MEERGKVISTRDTERGRIGAETKQKVEFIFTEQQYLVSSQLAVMPALTVTCC